MYTDKYGNTWFKGNLHMHTTNSDGAMSPEDAIALYRENGYDFVAITDHRQFCPPCEKDGILVLSGGEYNTGITPAEGIVHIVGVGMTEDPKGSTEDSPGVLIDKIHKAGGIAIWAHPAWSLNAPDFIEKYEGIDATEIYNSVSGFPRNVRPDSSLITDMLAMRGKPLKLAATDDTHFYECETCKSYIWVKAESCTREAILDAIRAGDFYASQGPEIEAFRLGDTITVETTPAASIAFFSDTVWVEDRVHIEDSITKGVYTIGEKDTFVRAEVIDADGNKAWTQYFSV